MKLERALSIIGLDRLPKDESELNAVYRELAKKLHPDAGGSEAAFQELGEAVEYLKRALLLLNQRVQTKARTEDALARKRAILREQMLRRRAEEDRLRNQQAQKWTIGLVVVLAVVGLWFIAQPKINHWMIERNRVERMAEVIRLDNHRTYTIEWTYEGKRFEKDINGRFIDGSWIVGPAGMPMLPGAKFVVAFNAENPNYYELLDQYIHTETAEIYFAMTKQTLANYMGTLDGDPDVVCLYWALLDEYGVEGIAHLHFRELPMRKNWSHNERTFNALAESPRFQELYRSCRLP